MRPYPRPNTSLLKAVQSPPVRFLPVMHLLGGDSLGLVADEPVEFEERAMFGRAPAEPLNAARWMAGRLERVASAACAQEQAARPILVTAPMAALADPNTAMACDASVRRTVLCQQEFCLMFPDAALSGDPADAAPRLARLRRAGFRVGIDMRHSWQTAFSEGIRMLIDTIRVDADAVEASAELCKLTVAAHACGVMVVADHASWRDGDFLRNNGIAGAVAPLADA